MTISTETIVAGPFTGNGVTEVFAFAFKVFTDADVLVKNTSTAGVDSTAVLNTDYTVSRNADQDANPGGTIQWKEGGVNAPLPLNEKVTITSQVANTQATALPTGGSYSAKTVERMIDKVTILVKQILRTQNRSLRQPITDATVFDELPNAATRRGMFLFFQDTAAAQPVAAAVTSGAAVTAAWKAVIETATLALGRAAMGFSAYFDTLIAAANAAAFRALFTPLTTKGDLWVFGAADARKAVGTDGYALQAQSGAADGLQYLPTAPFTLENGYLDWTVAGNVLTVAIKTWAGTDPSATDPVYITFRDPTAATGSLVKRKLTAATSIAINDTALLGTVNSVAFRLWCVAFDDGGTVRLALINCVTTSANAGSGRNVDGIYPLAGWGIASSTLEDNASDSAQVFYSAGAAVASKAYATLGYATWETGLAAAGTWSAAPTRKQLFGMGVPLPGHTIQRARAQSSALMSGTTAWPPDDSIPQITEGDQYFSQAVAPSSAANAVEVRSDLYGAFTTANDVMFAGIFKDAVSNALATSTGVQNPNANMHAHVHVTVCHLAGGTATTTFRVRSGITTPGTLYVNGSPTAARYFGGTMASFLEVEEIMG